MATDNPSFTRVNIRIPVSHTDCVTLILDDDDDDDFPRLANRMIAVFGRVLRTCLKFEHRSRVRGQLLSGRSYVQTRIKVNNAGRPLYYRHASGVSCEPALPSDTRRLPSPFMALYRTSASALESKFAAGFTVPLLACNKSGTGGGGITYL